jgi:hypothetical protein
VIVADKPVSALFPIAASKAAVYVVTNPSQLGLVFLSPASTMGDDERGRQGDLPGISR